MLRVGLTGNVASGKSTVLAMFREWGAEVADADVLARDAVRPGTPVLAAIVERFGQDVLLEDGSLDRAALRRRVMVELKEREALNAIVHPVVIRRAIELEREAKNRGAPVFVHDIPLLFEALDPAGFDVVVLVDAPPDVRRARIMAARGIPRDEADAMIAAQLPSERKRAQSHYTIDNDSTVEALRERAGGVWRELQRRAGLA